MNVYHLGTAAFAHQLTGEGAKMFGGRWNVIGCPCIYAAESKALSILEYAANVMLKQMKRDLAFTIYEIPDGGYAEFPAKELPEGWMEKPPPPSVGGWGTAQLQKKLALKLPSVIVASEFNYILNPLHPDFKQVRIKAIEPFTFDMRIKS